MIYNRYGKSEEKLSCVGFGGMRFENPSHIESSAETVLKAYQLGINYFDTAPDYCDGQSELIFCEAIKEMKRGSSSFYVSTKSNKEKGDELRADLEASLKRMEIESVDFFHIWCLLSLESWSCRKKNGAVEAALKAKEEGLIKHLCFSTHLSGAETAQVIEEGFFEGVTLGYSIANFPYREEGVRAAGKNGLGVVVMNPLGGGTITANKDIFSFSKVREGQSVLDGALHFLWSQQDITTALVGFRNCDDVVSAVEAVNTFSPYSSEEINFLKKGIEEGYNALCTCCQYCDVCPQGIPVWKFTETANQLYLKSSDNYSDRLKFYWNTSIDLLEKCTECRLCEKECTQKLPIMDRFEELKEKVKEESV